MRIAVVGAGIVGSCVAWQLTRRGAEVLLVDAKGPGAGVTDLSFSWVNASTETRNRAYFDLRVAGMAAHRELARALGSGAWWHPTGHLRWVEPAQSEALRAAVGHLRSWGYDAELWKAERVRRLLEPHVRFPSDDTEVAFFADEAWLEGRPLVARLVEEALANGAEAHFGRAVIEVVLRGAQIAEVVVTGGQRYKVDALINAAGPAGAKIAGLVGRALPMRDEPGLLARLRSDAVLVRRAMHGPHVELRPDGPGQVAVHSREIDAVITPAADALELAERLRRLAIDLVPELQTSSVLDARVARRPIPIDGFPSVGGVEDLGGYYEAVTHSGVTLAAIVGRLLAQEIVDGTVDELIAPFRPGRFEGVETASPRA